MRTRALVTSIMIGCLLFLMCIGFLLWLHLPGRDEILLLFDTRYAQLQLDANERFALRFDMAKRGYGVRFEEIPLTDLGGVAMADHIEEHTSVVVVSPLLSAKLSRDAAPFPPDLTTVALETGSEALFDIVFKRMQPDLGWIEVAKALSKVASGQPLPTILLHEGTDTAVAELFSEHFDGGALDVIAIEDHTAKEVEETIRKITASGALYVVVPYLEQLDTYLLGAKDLGIRWVLDSRFQPVAMGRTVEGVLADDIAEVVRISIESDPSVDRSPVLPTTYRSVGRVLRNSP